MDTQASEARLEAMLRAMESYDIDWLCGDTPRDILAAEWIENGFEPRTVGLWWIARCFEPFRAAELRDAGIEPKDICPDCAFGDTIGYHHSNCDLGLEEVRELIQ